MSKITLQTVLSSYSSASKINSNFAEVATTFENTLSRDGTGPNFMQASLDMNSNSIINLPAPVTSTDAVNKAYVDTLAFGGTITYNVTGRALYATTYAALKALTPTDGLVNGVAILVKGCLVQGDGGGGVFYYDSGSAATADNATIFSSTASLPGRFLRLYDSGQYQLAWWGVRGNNTDCATEFNQAMIDINTLGGGIANLDRGTTLFASQVSILGNNITIKGQAGFSSTLKSTYIGKAILVGPLATRNQEIAFDGVYFVGAEGQHLTHQRNNRGLFFKNCKASGLGSLVQIGDSSQASPAYITEIRDCEFGAASPTITVTSVIGTFTLNETLNFGTSGAKATIIGQNGSVYTLRFLTLLPTIGETITGATSGATATVSSRVAGLDFIDIRWAAGELNIYNSRVEGGYDWTVAGINFSNNNYENSPGIAGLFDTCGIHDTYFARFGYNIKNVDRRLGNVNWTNTRFHEAGIASILWEIPTGSTRPLDLTGGGSGVLSSLDLSTGYAIDGVYAKGLVFKNDSTVNSYIGDLSITGIYGGQMQNSLLELNSQRSQGLRGINIIGVTASQASNATMDAVSINAGSTSAFTSVMIDNIFAWGTLSDTVASNGSQTPDSGLKIGSVNATGTFTNRINGNFTRIDSASDIQATITNDSAAIGKIGELIESSIAVGSAVSLTTNVAANITSISLTAGDWDVDGLIITNPNAATTQSRIIGSTNTTSATQATAPNSGGYTQISSAVTGEATALRTRRRYSLASTTTIYLVITSSFGVNTQAAYGYLGARRVR